MSEQQTTEGKIKVTLEAGWEQEEHEGGSMYSRLVFTPDFHMSLDWPTAAILLAKVATAAALAEYARGVRHVCDDIADSEEEMTELAQHLMSMTPVELVHRMKADPFLPIALTPVLRKGGDASVRVDIPGAHTELSVDNVLSMGLLSMRSAVMTHMSNAIIRGLTSLPEEDGGTDLQGARTVVAHISDFLAMKETDAEESEE